MTPPSPDPEPVAAEGLREALDRFASSGVVDRLEKYATNPDDPLHADIDGLLTAFRAAITLDAARSAPPITATCDWGDCDEPTIAIRDNDGEWLSVCRLHVADAEAAEVAPIVSSVLAALPVREDGPTGIDEGDR